MSCVNSYLKVGHDMYISLIVSFAFMRVVLIGPFMDRLSLRMTFMIDENDMFKY